MHERFRERRPDESWRPTKSAKTSARHFSQVSSRSFGGTSRGHVRSQRGLQGVVQIQVGLNVVTDLMGQGEEFPVRRESSQGISMTGTGVGTSPACGRAGRWDSCRGPRWPPKIPPCNSTAEARGNWSAGEDLEAGGGIAQGRPVAIVGDRVGEPRESSGTWDCSQLNWSG